MTGEKRRKPPGPLFKGEVHWDDRREETKTPCKPYRRLLEEVVRFKSETETDNPTRRPE
jgi:hypothetical protein